MDALDEANRALVKNDLKTAIRKYKEAIAIKPYYGAYLNLSTAYKRNGQLDLAMMALQESVRLNDKNPGTYLNIGNLFKQIGKQNHAVILFIKAIQVDQKYAPAYNSLGTLFRMKGKLKLTEEYFRKAVSYDNNYKEAIHNLELLLLEKDNFMFSPGMQKANNMKIDLSRSQWSKPG